MDNEYCSPTGLCEPQWVFGAWWTLIVVGVVVATAYGRYRARRLSRIAASLGLAPNQMVVWRRWDPAGVDWLSRWILGAAFVLAIAAGVVAGAATKSFLVGADAALVPLAVAFGVLMVMDIWWLLRLHPTVNDIEPLDPPR